MENKDSIVNFISSTIEDSWVAYGKTLTPEEFLNICSQIMCQFDTDVAIQVFDKLSKSFGEIAKNESLSIKVNYGY
ncbi:MAG: hypothetical protein RLZZ479_1323 [Bacteroidota bacterium]|jgi:hypothetical protein